MDNVNNIINECGISKVKVAKFIGVSRQMLYNYLALDSLDELPKDKQNKLFTLFGIKDKSELDKLVINEEYITELDNRINTEIFDNYSRDSLSDLKGLNRRESELIQDIFAILKEKITDEKDKTAYTTLKYLHNFLQAMDRVPELKYILGYIAKSNGFIDPLELIYEDEDRQYTFEGILYSAMALYTNGGASRAKVTESHKKFEAEIEHRREEKLSRTQELNSFKIQALNELGYTSINENNAKEVFEKIAEIMGSKF